MAGDFLEALAQLTRGSHKRANPLENVGDGDLASVGDGPEPRSRAGCELDGPPISGAGLGNRKLASSRSYFVTTPGQAGNPLFNKNRLKLGTFATNTVGSIHTIAPDAYRPTWENSLRAAKLADSAGFEALLALARWKGLAKALAKLENGMLCHSD